MNNLILSAINIESYHIRYFYNLANRFLTFDKGISWLFKALAEEGEKNRQDLIKFGNRLMQPKIHSMDEQKNGFYYDRHFFVVDKEMALALMQAAITLKYTHQLFYERCYLFEIDPLLRLFYEQLSLFEKQHIQVLEESIERFYTDIHLGIHPV